MYAVRPMKRKTIAMTVITLLSNPGLATGGWQLWAPRPGSGVHGRGGRQVGRWQFGQSLWQRSSKHTKPPLIGWTMPSIVTTRSDRVSPRRRWFFYKHLKTNVRVPCPRPRRRPCVSVGTSWTRTFLSWPRQSPPGALVRWTCFCKDLEDSCLICLIIQVTMENLEESIRTLKEMFIERKPMIEVCDIFEVSFNFVW